MYIIEQYRPIILWNDIPVNNITASQSHNKYRIYVRFSKQYKIIKFAEEIIESEYYVYIRTNFQQLIIEIFAIIQFI